MRELREGGGELGMREFGEVEERGEKEWQSYETQKFWRENKKGIRWG